MPAQYSPTTIKLAESLMAAHGIDAMAALKAADDMMKLSHPVQAPVAPMPLNAHLATPEHLEDANLSAWQRYSQMLDAAPQPTKPKDASMGAASGKRTNKGMK